MVQPFYTAITQDIVLSELTCFQTIRVFLFPSASVFMFLPEELMCRCFRPNVFVEITLCTTATVQSYAVHHRPALFTADLRCAQGDLLFREVGGDHGAQRRLAVYNVCQSCTTQLCAIEVLHNVGSTNALIFWFIPKVGLNQNKPVLNKRGFSYTLRDHS